MTKNSLRKICVFLAGVAVVAIAALLLWPTVPNSHRADTNNNEKSVVEKRNSRTEEVTIPSRNAGEFDGEEGIASDEVSLALSEERYFAFPDLPRDFLPILEQLREYHFDGNANATYLMGLMLKQCRFAKRLEKMTATEFVDTYAITDQEQIDFYHLREMQCRSLFAQGLWRDQFSSTDQLIRDAASGGNPTAMVDLAFKLKRASANEVDVRNQFIEGISSMKPIALARASFLSGETSLLEDRDVLALLVLACEESSDCLASSGLLARQCDLSGDCVAGLNLLENLQISLGTHVMDQAGQRANDLRETLRDSGWNADTFSWKQL